jgi:hypothetical protein
MPLDQIALLSFTSTRTSEVFMTFCANFFTCWVKREGRDGSVGVLGKEKSLAERRGGSRPSRWTETTHPATMRRLDRHERRREDTLRTCTLERRVVNADWRSSRASTPRLARDPDA